MNQMTERNGRVGCELPAVDWMFLDTKGYPVSNAIPEVISEVNIFTDDNDEPERFVKLRFRFADDRYSENIEVPLLMIENENWLTRSKELVLNQPYKNAKLALAFAIRAALANAPQEERYILNRLGIHIIKDIVMFCAGDKIILSPDDEGKINVEPSRTSFRLDIDPELNGTEAISDMMKAANLSLAGRVLIAHAISGITRSVYRAVGITPNSILEISGKTGIFKSSYSSYMVQLYNRSDEISPDTRFNSSTRFIEELLYENSECTSVIDDICTAESGRIKRKNEETAEEIKRRVGDSKGRGRWDGNTRVQRNPRGNAVFTGEYPTGKESTAARGLIVPFQKPNPKVLNECQRKPLAVSTCYYYFIEWFVSNYYMILDELDRRLSKFRESDSSIHPRLRETQFCLQTAYMLFLKFCENCGSVTADIAREEYNYFGRLLSSLTQEQNTLVKMSDNKTEKVDYLRLITVLYNSNRKNRLDIAKSADCFDSTQHDGFIHNDELLCLRTDKLVLKLEMFIRPTKLSDVIETLAAKNAIKADKDKNTTKICGYRVLAIWLDKLK